MEDIVTDPPLTEPLPLPRGYRWAGHVSWRDDKTIIVTLQRRALPLVWRDVASKPVSLHPMGLLWRLRGAQRALVAGLVEEDK